MKQHVNTNAEATIEDLLAVPEHGRAELVNGKVVLIPPMTFKAGRAAMFIALSLLQHGKRTKTGVGLSSKVGYLCDLPHRKSFCPDAAFWTGPLTMGLPESAPVFAAEVRDLDEYTPKADKEFADKRADYFAAGTKVVWDVDIRGEDVVRVYRADNPIEPTTYRRGELAEAEPAVPGWTMPVDDIMAEIVDFPDL